MSSSLLEMRSVGLTFAGVTGVEAVRSVSLTVARGERIAIVGPSGCGKSSLLSLMAGLIFPSVGSVLFNGAVVRGPAPARSILFQSHALFPWLSAVENIEFVLRARRRAPAEAIEFLRRFDLADFAHAYPRQLSGGMQQRVGMARALACEPELLLLDEPFSALDGLTRDSLLEDLLPRLQCAVVLVTHSIEEALFVGDRVIVLSGRPGTVVGEFSFAGGKPASVMDMKRAAEYLRLEVEIYRKMKGVWDEGSSPDLVSRI